jgi:hypothetical protein
MALEPVSRTRHGDCWSTILALVSADGSAAHGWARHLTTAHAATRDLADAVHALCALHGAYPGVIDRAAENDSSVAREWLAGAAAGFAVERGWVAQVTSAAGPLPSTPGQAETEAAFTAQSHALDMLARSDRTGCAAGAAVALTLDWPIMRAVLDNAAKRAGLSVPASGLPDEDETAIIVSIASESAATERAMTFGTQQLLAQHRGLWDLLEARAAAREAL